MPRLIELLVQQKMTLIVALPENNEALATAAAAAGADALQLSLVESWQPEKAKIVEIVEQSKLPVGLALGQKKLTDQALKEIAACGFDFFMADLLAVPNYSAQLTKLSRIAALNSRFSVDNLIDLGELGADALSAAIIPTSGWGKELVVGDLQNYISIVLSTGIPVIIPTERCVRPSEVAIIADTEAKGLLITPVVSGQTAKGLEKVVREFRLAVDELG